MCGVAGIYTGINKGVALELEDMRSRISAMTSSLVARGPDGHGTFVEPRMALGHRRLSIIDLTKEGAQPMTCNYGGQVISYNGECYNFQELRKELEVLGFVFRGNSDTEVVLGAYAVWGLAGLQRIEGTFALGLWDPANQRLVLMRDRLGVKPLYYSLARSGLYFGSEIKAILAAGGVNEDLDTQAFSEYLWFGNVFDERTFYKEIRALQPGHWLIAEGGNYHIERWWRIEQWFLRSAQIGSFLEGKERIGLALDQAVGRQLVSDVPIGIFLSGGVDSSAIAAAAVRKAGPPLVSYCASFDFDQGINELPKARQVAVELGIEHHEIAISGANLTDVLIALARIHDEPFADAANIPLYLLCQELRSGVKVVLQGDGGDEMFGGYRRYSLLRNLWLWRLWPNSFTRITRSIGDGGRRWSRLVGALGMDDPAIRMALLLTVETLAAPPERFLSFDRREELAKYSDPFLAYRIAADRFSGLDPVQMMLATDLTVQLPAQFLTKVDRATMAAGVEARVPLLDERIAEIAVGMPSEWKVKGVEKKIILRESQRGRLPNSILDGPKTGFGVPYEYWLRTSLFEFARERLLDQDFSASFGFDRYSIAIALNEHKLGVYNHGFWLWKLLQLALWKGAKG